MNRQNNLIECGYNFNEDVKAFEHTCEDCGTANQDILICFNNNYEELFYCPDCLNDDVYESEALSVWERNQ